MISETARRLPLGLQASAPENLEAGPRVPPPLGVEGGARGEGGRRAPLSVQREDGRGARVRGANTPRGIDRRGA